MRDWEFPNYLFRNGFVVFLAGLLNCPYNETFLFPIFAARVQVQKKRLPGLKSAKAIFDKNYQLLLRFRS